ncbi:MAG: DUF6198 family protein [Mangrovibacterium sp.]
MKLILRILTFTIGLFILSTGVTLSVKANLGVSPISCIPYVYSLQFPLTLGQLTVILNVFFMLLQVLILRKNYRLIQLAQLPVVFVFGLFLDLTMNIFSAVHIEGYLLQVFFCLLSCVLIAFGVILEVKSRIIYLPGEGLAMAIAQAYKKEFGKAKVMVDCGMVAFGVISSFIFFHQLLGIREGTIVAAVLVGIIARFFGRKIQFIDTWLADAESEATSEELKEASGGHLVIAISREYGSGGHEIGKMLADKLGIAFYDSNLIDLTVEQSGFTSEYIQENEQSLVRSLWSELYEQNYAYINEQKPPLDSLFLVQSKIIREIAAKEACVIIGRCANFVLKDNPNCLSVFIHADAEYRKNKIKNDYGVAADITDEELKKIDSKRANYCMHYTNKDWRDIANYDLTLNSSVIDAETIVETLVEATSPSQPPRGGGVGTSNMQ